MKTKYEYKKLSRERRSIKGLCIECGKREKSNPDKKFGRCQECRNRNNKIKKLEYDQDPERALRYNRGKLRANRQVVLDHYGRKCACCGESIERFLCIDHINNDGNKHRREIGAGTGGSAFYLWLIKNQFPVEFQTLCYNCNNGKRFTGNCPHQEMENMV